MNWKRIYTPKQWGGLSLRPAMDMNQTIMMKAGWNLVANKDDLWAEVVRTKYKCGHDHIPITDPNLPGSNFGKGVESKLIWRVGLGTQVNVWEDRWIMGGNKLEELTLRPLAEEEKSLRVCDLSSPSEGCDLGKIAHIIPLEVGDHIF